MVTQYLMLNTVTVWYTVQLVVQRHDCCKICTCYIIMLGATHVFHWLLLCTTWLRVNTLASFPGFPLAFISPVVEKSSKGEAWERGYKCASFVVVANYFLVPIRKVCGTHNNVPLSACTLKIYMKTQKHTCFRVFFSI